MDVDLDDQIRTAIQAIDDDVPPIDADAYIATVRDQARRRRVRRGRRRIAAASLVLVAAVGLVAREIDDPDRGRIATSDSTPVLGDETTPSTVDGGEDSTTASTTATDALPFALVPSGEVPGMLLETNSAVIDASEPPAWSHQVYGPGADIEDRPRIVVLTLGGGLDQIFGETYATRPVHGIDADLSAPRDGDGSILHWDEAGAAFTVYGGARVTVDELQQIAEGLTIEPRTPDASGGGTTQPTVVATWLPADMTTLWDSAARWPAGASQARYLYDEVDGVATMSVIVTVGLPDAASWGPGIPFGGSLTTVRGRPALADAGSDDGHLALWWVEQPGVVVRVYGSDDEARAVAESLVPVDAAGWQAWLDRERSRTPDTAVSSVPDASACDGLGPAAVDGLPPVSLADGRVLCFTRDGQPPDVFTQLWIDGEVVTGVRHDACSWPSREIVTTTMRGTLADGTPFLFVVLPPSSTAASIRDSDGETQIVPVLGDGGFQQYAFVLDPPPGGLASAVPEPPSSSLRDPVPGCPG